MSRTTLDFDPLKVPIVILKTKEELKTWDANKLEQLREMVQEEVNYREELAIQRQREAEEAEKEEKRKFLNENIDKDWNLFSTDSNNGNVRILTKLINLRYLLYARIKISVERRALERYYKNNIREMDVRTLQSFPSAYYHISSQTEHFINQMINRKIVVPDRFIKEQTYRGPFLDFNAVKPAFKPWLCKYIKDRISIDINIEIEFEK